MSCLPTPCYLLDLSTLPHRHMGIHMDEKCPVRYGREDEFSNISHSISPLSHNTLKVLPWSIARPALQCFSLGRSCCVLKFTLSTYFFLSRNGPVRISVSQKGIGNDINVLKPTHTRVALIWHYALNPPEASLSCSRFLGLRRQSFS